ncbi:hypothetical protein HK101_007648, partial [Irineochytrium annulatum]
PTPPRHANNEKQQQQAAADDRATSPEAQGGDFKEVPSRRANHENRGNRPQAERPSNSGPSEEVMAKSICLRNVEGLSRDSIREVFVKLGKIVEVIMPKPNIAFIEFESQAVAKSAIGKQFTIEGFTVTPDQRRPKVQGNRFDNPRGRGGRGGGTSNRGDYHGNQGGSGGHHNANAPANSSTHHNTNANNNQNNFRRQNGYQGNSGGPNKGAVPAV